MLGPTFRRTTALAANATADPLFDGDWQFRRLPFNAMIQVIDNCTTVDVVRQVVVGSDQQGQEAPCTGGGTAGVFDNNKDNADVFLGAAGDQIRVIYRETAGAAATVNTVVRLQPI